MVYIIYNVRTFLHGLDNYQVGLLDVLCTNLALNRTLVSA